MDKRPFPPVAIFAAGLLMVTTVLAVGIFQHNKHLLQARPLPIANGAAAVESRELRFVDLKDGVSVYGGHVRVFDVATGAELPQLRERDGFIRAVLNSLAFERTKRDLDAPPIFVLTRWSDNRLTLTDKATGARISLGDFGPGNKSVFFRFLPQAGAGS